MKTIKNQPKNRYGVWSVVIALVFFFVGFFTLGNFSNTGENYYLSAGSSAVYELQYKAEQTYLKEVYINLGAVYVEAESEPKLTVKTSASTTSISPATWTDIASLPITRSGVNDDGLFNWSLVAKDLKKTASVSRINISADASVEINEIVCIANDGERIELKIAETGNSGSEEQISQLANVFDAQEKFIANDGAYYRFTQEEGVYLSYLRNLGLGSAYYPEDTDELYPFAEDFGAVAVLALVPSVALFGESVFALRLPSLVATTLTLLVVGAFVALLFKNEKYGFFASSIFALGGISLTAGRVGAPYAFVACALVGATYFAYKFFARGISEYAIFKDGSNVLFACLLCAVAVAMEGIAILPVLGVFGLLTFGAIRQKKAHVYALEKTDSVSDEERRKKLVKKENVAYSKKTRMVFGCVALGFFVFYLLLIFLSTIICHNAYARMYGANVGLVTMLLKNAGAGFRADVLVGSAQGVAIPFAWFLPLKSTVLHAKDAVLWLAIANPILTTLAFISLVYSSVIVIKTRKETDKDSKRVGRVYGVLLGGALLTALSALVKGAWVSTSALAFYAFYYNFILLAGYCIGRNLKSKKSEPVEEVDEPCKACKRENSCSSCKEIITLLSVLVAVAFVICLPAVFGFGVPTWWRSLMDLLTIL